MIVPRFHLFAVAAAVLVSAAPSRGAAGDNLTDRIVINPSITIPRNSTEGMTVEAGEINEAGGPAGQQDRSLWYEWTAAATGTAEWMLLFDSLTQVQGLAIYTLAPGAEPVTMERLRPAGALVVPAGLSFDERRVRLWVTVGQKFIARVWSAPSTGGTGSGGPFSLGIYTNPQSQRGTGDTATTPILLNPSSITSEGVTRLSRPPGWSSGPPSLSPLTTETDENFIDDGWHPGGCVQWFEWTAPREEIFRFSLTKDVARFSSVMVLRRETNGTLTRLSAPGSGAAFDAVKHGRYLVRLATPARWSPAQLELQGGPAEPGDEPATATALTLNGSASVLFAGASPSQLFPATDNTGGHPDVWFDLGNSLTGAFKVDAGDEIVTIYRAGPDGNPAVVVAGGGDAADTSFLAEPGRRYLARVMQRNVSGYAGPINVGLLPLSAPPVNDRRETATVLPANGPVLVRGDATGATAEESDGALVPDLTPARTVWYVLDRPASVEPWFVWTWNMQSRDSFFYRQAPSASLFREENGVLVQAELTGWPWQRCTLTGDRIWIMVSGNADPRFMLMAGPAITQGDTPLDPVPVTTGPVQFIYAGASTHDDAVPGVPLLEKTFWLSWTAAENGMVSVSHLGSPALVRIRVFTAALAPVTASVWNEPQGAEIIGQVTSFEAVAGTPYRFLLHGHLPGPVAVRVKPGGWQSPYEVWTQNFPAWENAASLSDPEADADADGIANLMEMACFHTRGPTLPDRAGFPWPEQADPYTFFVFWDERAYALRGPAGCIPFRLTAETGMSLTGWTPLFAETPANAWNYGRTWSVSVTPSVPQADFFRLRVHR